jgi:hypothetical protein
MADQISYRANLTNGYLPFIASQQGQTVIVPKQDNNLTPQDAILAGESASDRDRGFPQVMYMHDVLPTKQGFKSVGYNQKIAGLPGVDTFQDMFILRDVDENKFLYSPVPGQHYVWDGVLATWTPSSPIITSSSGIVTVAYINGYTYIFFQGVGCYQYDTVTNLLTAVTFTGITATLLNGICSSNGFLIAWDNFTVYRSKPTSILDFTSDPTLGSGSSIPNDIKGQIVACLPISDGFIIYCTKNAVAASFQNNIQYPFQYKEVKGSGGLVSPSAATWASNMGNHYSWTTNGLVSLTKLNAIQVFPEVTDFLTARIYEYYDTVTNTLQVTRLTSPLAIKLALVADRYLVISYGITAGTYTDALVYDLGYKRWGKVHITHTCAFEYYQPNVYGDVTWAMLGSLAWADLGSTAWADLSQGLKTIEQPNDTLAFLQQDGTVMTASLDMVTENEAGVLILGKYQFLRDRFLVLDEVTVQNGNDGQFTIVDLPTYDGVNFQPAQALFPDPDNTGTMLHYYSAVEAKNHALCCQGTFDLCDFGLVFHLGGHS